MPVNFSLSDLNSSILKNIWVVGLFFIGINEIKSQADPNVELNNNRTPTWSEVISVFEDLASQTKHAALIEIGKSDVGRPVHAFVLSQNAEDISDVLDLTRVRKDHPERLSFLVNNAIHPGEPCGVDASVGWVRELIEDPKKLKTILNDLDVAIIPMYNVGGALNRNCCSRTNQDGPESYGFRGNAKNLDLNRDFIKMDSENAFAFVNLFHAMTPHVFVDTHTTNGADYPYKMTLIYSQPDKAGPVLGPYVESIFEPALEQLMAAAGEPVIPYVNTRNQTPESGLIGFLETPRYSTGYAALFGTIGITSEAHMLKPFPERVRATKTLLESCVELMLEQKDEILQLKEDEAMRIQSSAELPIHWTLNDKDSVALPFSGYASRREISAVTGDIRLRYDRDSVWTKEIPYFNQYDADAWAVIPEYFFIPQAWNGVIERLKANQIRWESIPRDTVMEVRVQYIEGFRSSAWPYEGHHVNNLKGIQEEIQPILFFEGDLRIPSDQVGLRYLMETLDPRGHDSFFVWNFFDGVMQRKEGFSAYVFEETALTMLELDPELKVEFERERASNPDLMEARGQLEWLYQRSEHYEGSVNRYPVYQSIQSR